MGKFAASFGRSKYKNGIQLTLAMGSEPREVRKKIYPLKSPATHATAAETLLCTASCIYEKLTVCKKTTNIILLIILH